MNRRDKTDDLKVRSRKASSKNKTRTQIPGHAEDFNTGSHSPSSLVDVGAGYDDTGMGNDSQASGTHNKKGHSWKNRQKRKFRKNTQK